MKLTKFFTIVIFSLLTTAAFAQINLNKSLQFLEPNAQLLDSPAYDEAKNMRSFEINPLLQTATGVAVGDVVVLQLFENQTYNAVVSNIATNVNGTLTISFKLPEYPFAAGFVCTSTSGVSLFSLNIPELNQRFATRQNIYFANAYVLELREDYSNFLQNDQAIMPAEIIIGDTSTTLSNHTSTTISNRNGEMGFLGGECGSGSDKNPNDPVQIDLLIVYTPAAKAWADANRGDIEVVIAAAMERTKEVLENQGNKDTIKVIHTQLVDYVEAQANDPSIMINIDLTRLAIPADGYLDEVQALRKQHGADLVVLIGAYPTNTDGMTVGGLGRTLTKQYSNGHIDVAFSVVNVSTIISHYTLIHELGHNMGLLHEKGNQNPDDPLYPYAYGWYWTGNDGKKYGSVMTYAQNRAPYFSNPEKLHEGVATGKTGEADNAQVFRNMKHTVALYSDRLQNTLEAPKNLSVSKADDPVISWDKVTDATMYRLTGLTPTSAAFANFDGRNVRLSQILGLFPAGCTEFTFTVAAVNDCDDAGDVASVTFLADGTTIATYTVTFNSNGGTPVATQNSKHGSLVAPVVSTKANHTLAGWFTEETFINEWDFETDVVTKNMTLWAQWNCIHNFTALGTFVTAATCETPAKHKAKCSICGVEHATLELDGAPALGHNYPETWTLRTPAKCEIKGVEFKLCSRENCGHEITQDIPVLGHSYPETWTVRTPANCKTKGLEFKVCIRINCEHEITKEIPASAHDFTKWIVNPDNKTEELEICSICGEKSGVTREKVCDHKFTVWEITKVASCTEKGEKTEKCAICGTLGTQKQEIPMLEHNYTSVVTAPTCTAKGFTTYTCSLCGTSYDNNYVSELGHSYPAMWTVRTPAKCGVAGLEFKTCTRENCTHEITQVIEALEHDYKAVVTVPTCTEKGYTTYTCSICSDSYVDDEVAATGHTNIWIINPDNENEEIEICSLCNEKSGNARPVTAIETITNGELQITVYPNPTTGRLTITGVETQCIASLPQTIEIYDIYGRLVETQCIASLRTTGLTIDISHLANGVYFICINGERVKIVKQ